METLLFSLKQSGRWREIRVKTSPPVLLLLQLMVSVRCRDAFVSSRRE